jgi:hypothetical protein
VKAIVLSCCLIGVVVGPLVGSLAAQQDTLTEDRELVATEEVTSEFGDLATGSAGTSLPVSPAHGQDLS